MLSKEKIKDVLSLTDVAEQYSPKVANKGKITYIICPFHDDKHIGSCYFYNDRNTFVCKSCGEHGDALRLASGYTGIPLSSLNELLERIVAELGWDRRSFTKDERPEYSTRPLSKPIVSDEVYTLLTGAPYIRTAIEFVTKSINGQKVSIPTKYNMQYYRSMARQDPKKHDEMLCRLSRIEWRKAVKKSAQCLYDDTAKRESDRLSKLFREFSLPALVSRCGSSPMPVYAPYIREDGVDAADFWPAVEQWQNDLLATAIREPSALQEELVLRSGIRQREYAVCSTIQMLLKK